MKFSINTLAVAFALAQYTTAQSVNGFNSNGLTKVVVSSGERDIVFPVQRMSKRQDRPTRMQRRVRGQKRSIFEKRDIVLPNQSIPSVLHASPLDNVSSMPLSSAAKNPGQLVGGPLSNLGGMMDPANNVLVPAQNAAAKYMPAEVAKTYNAQAPVINKKIVSVQKTGSKMTKSKMLKPDTFVKIVKTGKIEYGPVKGNVKNAKKLQRIQRLKSLPMPGLNGIEL